MNRFEKHIKLTVKQEDILNHLCRCSTSIQRLVKRTKIILGLDNGKSLRQVARELKTDKKTVKKWCDRWNASGPKLIEIENNLQTKPKEYSQKLIGVLNDAPRSGAPQTFTAEQIVQIVSIACEVIDDSERPYSRWTQKEIANEAV